MVGNKANITKTRQAKYLAKIISRSFNGRVTNNSNVPVFVGKFDDIIQMFGIDHHYMSMSRGVLDTRDIIYFLSLISFFIMGTKVALESRKW